MSRWNSVIGGWALALVLCGPAGSASAAPGGRTMKPDQVNVEGWDKAWTNLVNNVQQTFVPSLPRLTAVEVELVVGNPGPAKDELTLTILDADRKEVAAVTQMIPAADCERALFLIPDGGVDVIPGETYSIRLAGETTFGWKYAVGGYPTGAATFNGKPLLAKTRSTFLFRTFGSD